jgi:CRISPR-associated protein Csm1
VPIFDAQDKIVADRYPADERKFNTDDIKTFNHLACENKVLNEYGKWQGIEGLGILKGDVDNLGSIFQHGQNKPNFAKMAALSRQMNAFFAIYLPALCKQEFKNVYTVFAGGDDFFLIGPWYDLMRLANKMQEEFSRYCAKNTELHFSAGLMLTKAGVPISYLADQAEESLEKAKYGLGIKESVTAASAKNNTTNERENKLPLPKNHIHCLGETLAWHEFTQILQACEQLNTWQQDYKLSTGFSYALLQWSDMAAAEKVFPAQAIWRSQVSYRVFRHLESSKDYKQNRPLLLTHSQELTKNIGNQISSLQQGYRVAVTTHLYRYRNTSH